MKTLRILSTIALVAVTVLQTYWAARYRRLAETAKAQAVAMSEQADTLNHQVHSYNSLAGALTNRMEEYNALPRPYAEWSMQSFREAGFTNIMCLVIGEHDGRVAGFLVESNEITPLKGEIRFHHPPEDEAKPAYKRPSNATRSL